MTAAETGAISYLSGIGPRSNLGKIRSSLEELEEACPDGALRSLWDAAEEALGNADDICNAESGAEAEEKTEARDELESSIEELVGAIEDAREADAATPATPDVTDPGQPEAWHPLMLLEQYTRDKLGAKEFRLQGRDRDALLEFVALWADFTRGEGPCPCCGRTDGQRGAACFPSEVIRAVQARQARAETIAKLERQSQRLGRELANARAAAQTVTPAVTGRRCACGCGQLVTSPRPEAKYASGACRVRAHRAAQSMP